jgi:nitroreductase
MPIMRETERTEQVLRLLSSPERKGICRPAGRMPEPQRWPAPTTEIVRSRHSVRTFSTEPIDIAHLRVIIDSAHLRHPGFSVLIAAYRVADLDSGTYLAEPGNELTARPEYILDGVREAYADAAALLIICGDLAAAVEADGPNGYSRLLVQAGAFAYTAWLTALSLGLAGSVYGRSNGDADAAARRSGGLRHLFTAALGREPRAGAPTFATRRGIA